MTEKSSTSNSFHLFNNYYDLLYHEKDYEKEAQYINGVLNKYNPAISDLLELGCGTGNYSKYFSDSGYTITGIELSEQMVSLAKSKSIPRFLPLVGDISTFEVDKKFDAAISLFHVLSYLTETSQVLSCLKQVGQHLKKDGLFVFDVWYTPAVYSQQPRTSIKRVTTDEYHITRIAEPLINYENNVVQVNYQLIIKNNATQQHELLYETHFMRHFSTPEIMLMAQLSGFRLIHSEQFLTAKQPCADTWGVCYTLQKND
jgi:SAM-dependent methyltransferase